jgi:hypothetical protein
VSAPASAKILPIAEASQAPFLVWPVSRREFYRTICIALVPCLGWGVFLFGSRALAMILLSLLAVSLSHHVLKRLLKWPPAQCLLYMHCLASAMILVALALPSWPIWIVTTTAFLLPAAFTVIGGPGRERIHVAVASVLVLQYVLLPHVSLEGHAGRPAILARDRIFMGDILDQDHSVSPAVRWPSSRELGGNDAVTYLPPAQAAADTLDKICSLIPTPDKGILRGLTPDQFERIHRVLEQAFTFDLPAMDIFMLGVAPNRLGAASLIAITLAGLYLSYRYVLRPRSILFFLVGFIGATMAFAFTPMTIHRVGIPVLWDLFSHVPGEIITLVNFLLLNSDAPFAAVFILALPGAEPLTARGRRFFLMAAAVGAAGLHRLDPAAPAATLALCVMMPVAPLFDRILVQRSWLNTR